MRISTLAFLIGAGFALAACNEEKTACDEAAPAKAVRTVDWFKAHKEERESLWAACQNNPGEGRQNPECWNADKARQDLIWDSDKGLDLPPPEFVVNFAMDQLTPEDFRKDEKFRAYALSTCSLNNSEHAENCAAAWTAEAQARADKTKAR